jgi:hypothetical protein
VWDDVIMTHVPPSSSVFILTTVSSRHGTSLGVGAVQSGLRPNVAVQLSPQIRSWPLPLVMLSPAAPPMITLYPLPAVIMSAPACEDAKNRRSAGWPTTG